MRAPLPTSLEPHRTYQERADELRQSHPLVALQCRLMLLQLGMRQTQEQLGDLAAAELRQWMVLSICLEPPPHSALRVRPPPRIDPRRSPAPRAIAPASARTPAPRRGLKSTISW